jgi:predicted DNA-binding transcriptional regulator AlpA
MTTTSNPLPKADYSNTPIVIANQLPETGFLRIWQIVGNRKTNTPALIPIGRTTFLNGVKSGKFPAPIKLSERTTAWKVEDIRALIEKMGASA